MCLFDTLIYYEMITTAGLVNTFITSHNYHFLVCVRTFKISQLSLLLTIITMLYIRSLELIHCKTVSWCPLINISPFSPPLSPWQPPFYSVSVSLAFIDSTYRWYYTVSIFLCLTNFTHHNALQVHPLCCKRHDFLLSHDWIIVLCQSY